MKEKEIITLSCIALFLAMLMLNVYVEHRNQIEVKDYSKTEEVTKDGTLYNVWVKEGKGKKLTALINGGWYELELKKKLDKGLKEQIVDLEVKAGEVQQIILKGDTIKGKVLAVKEDTIEIEGYGELPLGRGYKVYQTFSTVVEREEEEVLVGMEEAEFVVADGEVCATLIHKPADVENIRVLIKSNGYKSDYHSSVTLTGTTAYTVTIGEKVKEYKKGEQVTLTQDEHTYGEEERIVVKPKKADGKITLVSLERSCGHPSYRGKMEVEWKKGNGLVVINEVSVEEYLYGVIGSEMPVSYGEEALKVQAVCARSYAHKQRLQNGCGELGAHVDDSVSYQVYNNVEETEETIAAVEATRGKVMKYEDEVITAYYFSTSCGYTASAKDVWAGTENSQYLEGGIQSEKEESMDLSVEENFHSFVKNKDFNSYDEEFPWFRWKVSISSEQLQNAIENNIISQYRKNSKTILTKQEDGSFASKYTNSVGEVKKITVTERGESGVVKAIKIEGTKATIKVKNEYTIRLLLAPYGTTIYRQDGSQVDDMTMLPSGFFMVTKKNNQFVFQGGGYGHGVGMSQNGAKAMADKGYDYEEILQHYYAGVEVEKMTEE